MSYATFSNPRLSALPCELMRGCSFAEDFIDEAHVEFNNGILFATTVVDRKLDLNLGYAKFDTIPQPYSFSVVIRFSISSQPTLKRGLIGNADLTAGSASNGFCIWVEGGSVYANHSTASTIPTACSVAANYYDGEIHTVTYVVNMAVGDIIPGTHTLYVDALAASSQSTTIYNPIGDINNLHVGALVGGAASGRFINGTIYKTRIFDQKLTEEEHDHYHADTLLDFMTLPTAVYRCDSICDDTDGNYIWDRTTNLKDLTKGDRATTAYFPTFVTDKYLFDLVDDYVSAWPTLPSTYTAVYALSTPQEPFPYIRQENDDTFMQILSGSGEHWGYVHNMAIYSGVLTQLQLYHTEYMHLYNLVRGRASGFFHRTITEGTCKFIQFLNAGNFVFLDWSQMAPGVAKLVTRDGLNGCTFGSATSHVLFEHSDALMTEEISINVHGNFASATNSTLVDKGYIKLRTTSGDTIDFNGSTINHTISNNYHIAVTAKKGSKPRFYVDCSYIGEGSAVYEAGYLLADGDMETSGVGAWTAGNNATLTKDTTSPYEGSQCLRIAYNGTTTPYAYQSVLTAGKTYKISGRARGDGTYYPFLDASGAPQFWTGTTSTSWQSFDEIFTVTAAVISLATNASGTGYVEFDDIKIIEIDDLYIGNNTELNERCQHALKGVYIGDKALTDNEIMAACNMAEHIGESLMETGQRVAVATETFTGVAVDYDVDPGGNFQLLDVAITFNTAPTTSENLTIFSLRDGVKIIEDTVDPSSGSLTQYVFTPNPSKRFDNGITYGVDYTNTDARTIKVYSQYQTDPSIT